MGGFSTLGGGGIKKLSELIIDADKDWQHKEIINAYLKITEEPIQSFLIDSTVKSYVISDDIYAANDDEAHYSGYSGGGTKLVKEFTLPSDFPTNSTLRIYFEGKGSSSLTYAQIYRNGSPVGTKRSIYNNTYLSFVEDISGWNPGDKVQLYVETNADAWVRNFRILGKPYVLLVARESNPPSIEIWGQKYEIQVTLS